MATSARLSRRAPDPRAWGLRGQRSYAPDDSPRVNSKPSVTLGHSKRSPAIVRLPLRAMFWRSLTLCARRVSVALALLLSTLPLATPGLAAELIVDNSD